MFTQSLNNTLRQAQGDKREVCLKGYQLEISEIKIQVTQKKIRSMRLKVCAPDGAIKISVPLRLSQEKIKQFIISKLDWIKTAQIKIRGQKITPKKTYITGEIHAFFDKDYLLEVIETNKKPHVLLTSYPSPQPSPSRGEGAFRVTPSPLEGEGWGEGSNSKIYGNIKLFAKKNSTIAQRKKLLDEFYRQNLKKIIPNYIKKWEKKMNLKVLEFGVKEMKTRWGTCNIKARRIWLNLELAKKPLSCLEYIVVHEMVHLLEKYHNKKFFAHMDRFLPKWREFKAILKN